MNIMLCTRTYYEPLTGGVANSLYYLSTELTKLGHHVIIYSENVGNNLPENEIINGIQVYRHPFFPRMLYMREDIIYLSRLKKHMQNIVQTQKIDFIISRHLTYSYIAIKMGIKYSYYMPSLFPKETIEFMRNRNANILKKLYLIAQSIPQYIMEKRVVRNHRNIIVLSKMRKEEIEKYYNIKHSKILVQPPGIDRSIFHKRSPDPTIMKEYKISKDRLNIVTICRQEYRKNLDGLIEEYSTIINQAPNTRLYLVGTGPQHYYLKDLIRGKGLTERVFAVGYQADSVSWYNIADIFIFPSLQEGFGQVFIEAMACGTPCIGYKQGFPLPLMPTSEIVEHGKSGLLADYSKKNDLGLRIIELVKNKQLLARMGRAASLRSELYTWESTALRFIENYNSY
jgi:glycosyltransferase involved in cell wall biosynthesis